MSDDELLDEFWDAALDGAEIDHDSFLKKGGSEVSKAVDIHKLLTEAAGDWKNPDRPTQLGRFDVLDDLGAGGLGRVYLCWDPELRRQVAVKVIARDNWAVNEARSIARLDHQAVVKVFEVGHDRIVMELLDGGSMAEIIEQLREGAELPLSEMRARLHCLARLAEGLSYCHGRGILHRDVKPANVLFAKGDVHPRLVDFGLAHIEDEASLDITQNLVGSPAYLAPEQVESGETGSDQRSDIFSFGVLAQELLTLTSPFRRSTRTATLDAIRLGQIQKSPELTSDIPKAARHIIQHCLEPDPNDRYQSMEQVARDLQDALANRPISVGGRSALHKVKLLYKRNQRVALVATTGVLASVAISMALWLRALEQERSDVREQISTIATAMPRHSDPAEFLDTGLQLNTIRAQATSIDKGQIGSLFFGTVSETVTKTIDDWSNRLGAIIRSESDFDRDVFPNDAWKGLLQTDQYINSAGSPNRDLHSRGRITLSEELRGRSDLQVLRQQGLGEWWVKTFGMFISQRTANFMSGYRSYVPIRWRDYPKNGSYRFVVPGRWSRELVIETPWTKSEVVELGPRRLDSTGWFSPPDGSYLASPLITLEDARSWLEATGTSAKIPAETDATTPLLVTWRDAAAYATWAGGRLPLAAELGPLLEAQGTPDSLLVIAEYAANTEQSGTYEFATAVDHSDWARSKKAPPLAWLRHQCGRESILQVTVRLGADGPIAFQYYAFRVIYDQVPSSQKQPSKERQQ